VSAASADNLVSQVSEVTEEANNDADDETGASSQFGATGRKKRRTLGATTSSVRQIGKAVYVGKLANYEARARAEINTRADTVRAGLTFMLYESTGKVVGVSVFHKSMGSKRNMQVVTRVTAVDLENDTIIASFPQRYNGKPIYTTNSNVGVQSTESRLMFYQNSTAMVNCYIVPKKMFLVLLLKMVAFLTFPHAYLLHRKWQNVAL
jgi:hypothetical protein